MNRHLIRIPSRIPECSATLAFLVVLIAATVLAGSVAIASELMVNPYWVDETLVPPDLEYGTTGFATLTAAIAAAVDGDRVVLAPGKYVAPAERFPIRIDKAIEILSAAGSEQTVVSCLSLGAALEIAARDVRIDGLSIEFTRYGVVVLADDASICDSHIFLASPEYRQTSCGIWLAGVRNARIEANDFTDCGLAIAGPPVSDASQDLPVLTGLFEVGDDPAFFTTHHIQDNTVNGAPLYYLAGGQGVRVPDDAGQVILADCHDVTLEDLDISWASIGIEVAHSTGVRIARVTASNCGLFGIYLCYSDDCLITDARCEQDTHGLDLRAVRRNVIRDSAAVECGQGIFLSWGFDCVVSACVAERNGLGVFVAAGGANRIESTSIIENEIGINVEDEQSLRLTGNIVSAHSTTGMRFRDSDCTIDRNSVSGNWVGAIIIDCGTMTVLGNEFRLNSQCGLFLMNVGRIALTCNRFMQNPHHHLEVAGTMDERVIVHNSFASAGGLVLSSMEDVLDLRSNWWGTTDPDQIAQHCRGVVEYVPFLEASPECASIDP